MVLPPIWQRRRPADNKPDFPRAADSSDFKKGKTMKSVSFSVCKAILGIILCVLVFLPIGCKSQLGETTAEGHRRHKRALRINNEAMMGDIDRVLLLDQPSKLTDKRIP